MFRAPVPWDVRGRREGGALGRRRAHWGGLAALGTAVAWTPALAQTADIPPTDDVRHLTISADVDTTYDTNVAAGNAAEAALRHLKPEDVYVDPAVTIDALLPVNREAFFLTGSVGYDFYDRNTVLDAQQIDLTGGLSARLLRCQPRLKGTFAQYQSHLEELLAGPNAPIATPKNTATQAGVSFDLSCPRTEGLSPTISVSHSSYDNSNTSYKYTNNNSTLAQGGLSYTRPGFGAIQTYGSFTSVDYDNAFPISFPPFQLKNSYDLYAGGVRYDRPVGSRLSGTVSIAYSSLRPALSFIPGFSGVTYSAELRYHMSPRLDLHALVSRATLPSNEVGVAYMIDNARQIDASYSLGPRLKLTVGGFDDPRSYEAAFTTQISNLLTSDRTDRIFGSLSMNVNRRFSVVLDVFNEHRASNVALYNYTSNRVSLTLKSVF
jgi:hypothetical protein